MTDSRAAFTAPRLQEAAQPGHYGYFEHDADIGVIGRGVSVERALESAAEATFAIMADPALLREMLEIEVSFDEDDIEFALVKWLNALIAAARENGAVFKRFELARRGTQWLGRAWGERWREDIERGVEVKGATLTMLSVKATAAGWEARCVVDV
jgi:SHS2 domain-containing protein